MYVCMYICIYVCMYYYRPITFVSAALIKFTQISLVPNIQDSN